MPGSAEHRAKHLANRHLLDTGNNGTPLSTLDGCWAAIVAFYAALHCVDRLGAIAVPQVHPTPPGAHGKRLRFLYANHRAIFAAYNDLKTASEIARYGTQPVQSRLPRHHRARHSSRSEAGRYRELRRRAFPGPCTSASTPGPTPYRLDRQLKPHRLPAPPTRPVQAGYAVQDERRGQSARLRQAWPSTAGRVVPAAERASLPGSGVLPAGAPPSEQDGGAGFDD